MALGIDIEGIRAACKAHNARHPGYEYDVNKAILAEIQNQEIIAADRARDGASVRVR